MAGYMLLLLCSTSIQHLHVACFSHVVFHKLTCARRQWRGNTALDLATATSSATVTNARARSVVRGPCLHSCSVLASATHGACAVTKRAATTALVCALCFGDTALATERRYTPLEPSPAPAPPLARGGRATTPSPSCLRPPPPLPEGGAPAAARRPPPPDRPAGDGRR